MASFGSTKTAARFELYAATNLLEADRVAGPLAHDGKIAALCLQHGLRELWSADRDFSCFPSLRVVNPLL